jgi:PAS domain S-box-containing protein
MPHRHRTPAFSEPAAGPDPMARARHIRPWWLVFIVLVVVALAVLPVLVGERIAGVEQEVSEVLEPARTLAADLALVQARQMLRFREYLLTGDSEARRRYLALLPMEERLQERLMELLERMDLSVRPRALPLVNASLEWHLAHRPALIDPEARLEYLPEADADQRRYEEMLAASQAFRDLLAQRAGAARERMDEARRLQLYMTAGLLTLALVAVTVVAVLGRRLRGLVAEAERRRSAAVRARREIDAILEATGDAVLGVDLEGRIMTMNAAGVRLLGWSEEEARGEPVHTLLHGRAPDDEAHSEAGCAVQAAVREGRPRDDADAVIWNRRGGAVRARVSLRPLLDGRDLRGAVVTVSDLTQVRQVEEALRRAVAAREETMAVVSHDLRNPLSSISAAAELLLEVPLPEDRRRQQLRGVRRATERMHRLISDLLDVARIDAGGLSVEPLPVDPASLIREAAELFHSQAREAGVDVTVTVAPGTPDVDGDRDRLLQVLGNLLGNALRYTPERGRIVVAARPDEPAGVVITVSDTGPGISEEDLPHLFDRFWRRDHADVEGAGLGLAIVKGIVEAHGGRVEVEAADGEGATFHVHLPEADRVGRAADDDAAPVRPTLRLSRAAPPARRGDG